MANWSTAQEVTAIFEAPPQQGSLLEIVPTNQFPGEIDKPSPRPTFASPASTAVSDTSHTSGNWIVRHWRGELSLPVSYWLIGIATNITMAVLTGLFLAFADQDLSPAQIGASLIAFIVTILSLATWQLVGIWRSAGVHYHLKNKFWGGLARFIVIVSVIHIASEYKTFGPMIAESVRQIAGHDDTPPYTIRLLRQGTEVELSGGMPAGTADALKTMLDAAPQIKVVHLNSIGGFVAEGEKIRKLIEQRGLVTYTSTQCASACTVAYLGGTSRYLSPRAKLGFHSARFGSLDATEDLDFNSSMTATFRRFGASEAFIKKAFSTPSKDMWYPAHDELLENGIVTELVDANEFGISGATGSIDPRVTRPSLESALKEYPYVEALKRNEPAYYAKFLEIMTSAIEEGKAVADMQRDIKRLVIVELLPKYLKYGRHSELKAYWNVQLAEMRHLQSTDVQKCVAYILPDLRTSSWDLSRSLPPDLIKRDLAALAALIGAGANVSAPLEAPTDDLLAKLFAVTEQTVPRATAVIANPSAFKTNPRMVCDAFIAFYASVLALPTRNADLVLRAIFSE